MREQIEDTEVQAMLNQVRAKLTIVFAALAPGVCGDQPACGTLVSTGCMGLLRPWTAGTTMRPLP